MPTRPLSSIRNSVIIIVQIHHIIYSISITVNTSIFLIIQCIRRVSRIVIHQSTLRTGLQAICQPIGAIRAREDIVGSGTGGCTRLFRIAAAITVRIQIQLVQYAITIRIIRTSCFREIRSLVARSIDIEVYLRSNTRQYVGCRYPVNAVIPIRSSIGRYGKFVGVGKRHGAIGSHIRRIDRIGRRCEQISPGTVVVGTLQHHVAAGDLGGTRFADIQRVQLNWTRKGHLEQSFIQLRLRRSGRKLYRINCSIIR